MPIFQDFLINKFKSRTKSCKSPWVKMWGPNETSSVIPACSNIDAGFRFEFECTYYWWRSWNRETAYSALCKTGFRAETRSGYLILDIAFFENPEILVIQKEVFVRWFCVHPKPLVHKTSSFSFSHSTIGSIASTRMSTYMGSPRLFFVTQFTRYNF